MARPSRRMLLASILLGASFLLSSYAAARAVARSARPVVEPFVRAALHPGVTTWSLDNLEPKFRTKVDRVLDELREDGFHPRVASTWRSPDRQEFIYERGRLRQRVFGGAPSTQVRGGMSCHNTVELKDRTEPAALAIDVMPGKSRRTSAEKAKFFRALGKAAEREGLLWGGRWKRSNATWAAHGLGWDPGHLQSRLCTLKLRRRLAVGR